MNDFDFRQYCLAKLLETVPEIEQLPRFVKNKDWFYYQGIPLTHAMYEDVLRYYFLELIDKKDLASRRKVKKIAKLIDDLLHHENFQVRCIAEVGFLEGLLSRLDRQKQIAALKCLLPHTLSVFFALKFVDYGIKKEDLEG